MALTFKVSLFNIKNEEVKTLKVIAADTQSAKIAFKKKIDLKYAKTLVYGGYLKAKRI